MPQPWELGLRSQEKSLEMSCEHRHRPLTPRSVWGWGLGVLGWPTSALSICALSISPWFGHRSASCWSPRSQKNPKWGGFKL